MNHSGTTTLNHLWDADHKNTRKISRNTLISVIFTKFHSTVKLSDFTSRYKAENWLLCIMFWFTGLCRFMVIFGVSGGPSNRICYQKLVDENEHNSHGHFLMFDVYGTNFPHNAESFCVHLFSSIFWECFRNHMFRWSILDQNVEKCRRRCDWLFWRSVGKNSKKLQNGNFEGRF